MIRDLVSSEVLYSEPVPKQDARCLGTIAQRVVNPGIPIRGVVFDKGNGLVAAVESVLLGVPHQLWQTHFLNSAAKFIEGDLPELSAVIMDTLSEIKKLDRELAATEVKFEAPATEAELESL